jgi:hypothetical protein
MWALVADIERERALDEHMEPVVEFAEGHRAQLVSIRPRCDQIDIYCGVFANDAQGGWLLTPALMRRLASLDLAVWFDLYSTAESASG